MTRWTIDLGLGEIRDGAGEHLALRRRPFELLLYLAARHDQIVPKAELIKDNWRDVVVTDDSLTKAISEIRHALGKPAADTLKTVSGRGYVLTGWTATEARLSLTELAGGSQDRTIGNLPMPRKLVGRDADIAHIGDLLSENRLLTVIGPGGVGKSSLSLAVAAAVSNRFPDGAYYVDLAPLVARGAVLGATLTAFDMAGGQLTVKALAAEIRPLHVLLILDNCEHLIDEAASLATAILSDTGATILATSREALGVESEQLFRLQTLAYPLHVELTMGEAASYPAVALLETRARLAVEGFELRDTNLPAAIEICRRLDGVPLAIVLAAARLSAMSVEELASSLRANFDLLVGPRTATERQRTLRALVAWSVNLLTEPEQRLFAQIGVFAGSASAEDIAAVCSVDGAAAGIGLISSLADKSLLNVSRTGGATRYGYFETTRHYALERLATESGNEVRRRHAAHVLAKCEDAEHELKTVSSADWRARYEPYLDNLRAALTWCFSPRGDAVFGARLVAQSADLFDELSLEAEWVVWLDRAIGLGVADGQLGLLGRLKQRRSQAR